MIGIGFAGCGSIAEEHCRAIREVDGIEVRGCYDLDAGRGAVFALQERCVFHDTYADLLNDRAIDAVYICTHHDSHRDLAVAACHAGKSVMMEKPLALTESDCRAIVKAVEESCVTFMTAFKLRYYPMVARARQFAPRPLIAMAQVMDNHWPDDFWAQDPVRGGGNVLSQGVHVMDLLCHLFDDDPVSVHAEGGAITHPGGSLVDAMVATVRFTRGGIASVVVSDAGATPFVSKFSCQFADGVRSVHLHERLRAGVFYDGAHRQSLIDDRELGMILENREFVDALTQGRAPLTGVRDGLRATLMVLAAFRSIETGAPQLVLI